MCRGPGGAGKGKGKLGGLVVRVGCANSGREVRGAHDGVCGERENGWSAPSYVVCNDHAGNGLRARVRVTRLQWALLVFSEQQMQWQASKHSKLASCFQF